MSLFKEVLQEQQVIDDLRTEAYVKEQALRNKLIENDWYAIYYWDLEWFISPALFDFIVPIDFPNREKVFDNYELYHFVEDNVKLLLHDNDMEDDTWYGHIVYFKEED